MKEDIIKELKTVYDPEMPSVDVFNLGLIYDIDIKEDKKVTITHTLTSMLCPAADIISKNIKEATERVAGEGNVKIILTHTCSIYFCWIRRSKSMNHISHEMRLITC